MASSSIRSPRAASVAPAGSPPSPSNRGRRLTTAESRTRVATLGGATRNVRPPSSTSAGACSSVSATRSSAVAPRAAPPIPTVSVAIPILPI